MWNNQQEKEVNSACASQRNHRRVFEYISILLCGFCVSLHNDEDQSRKVKNAYNRARMLRKNHAAKARQKQKS
jgi:hypothetical protein